MEVLKLTSIRLSKSTLYQANHLAKSLGHYRTSDIIRVAIWIGLKFIKSGILPHIMHMMWQEEENFAYYDAQDVLRAADIELENLKSSK